MRKIFSLLLVFAALFTFAACENTPQTSSAGESDRLSAKEVWDNITDEALTAAFLHPQTFTEEETEKYTRLLMPYVYGVGLRAKEWFGAEELSADTLVFFYGINAYETYISSAKIDGDTVDVPSKEVEEYLNKYFDGVDSARLHTSKFYHADTDTYRFPTEGGFGGAYGFQPLKVETHGDYTVVYGIGGVVENESGAAAVVCDFSGSGTRYLGAKSNIQ